MKNLDKSILEFLNLYPNSSSSDIHKGLDMTVSYASVRRRIKCLVDENVLSLSGKGRSIRYALSSTYQMSRPLDMDSYFSKEIDDRLIIQGFNFELMQVLKSFSSLFTPSEVLRLNDLQAVFSQNFSELSPNARRLEMERLGVDLSWKSSQIEGNTYSLLETERLLKDAQEAKGKSKQEAVMLLNHKEALDFILENKDYLEHLSVDRLENIHSILIKDLPIDRNIRTRRVGITGTNYCPLDNEFQIREALESMCHLVNSVQGVFDKSFLVLLLISYIQPFNDGNKRTARIVANAMLIAHQFCPISFRSVDSIDYKKAMLLFYEQNNFRAMKDIFIDQFQFAVKTYF